MKKRYKFTALIFLSLLVYIVAGRLGFNFQQALSLAVFSLSICGTLLFWQFRLSFSFLGVSLLLLTNTINLENLIRFASLEIILFLVGMMIIVGMLKDSGFFSWIVQLILRIPNLTAKKFLIVTALISAALTMMIDEVSAIIFVVAAILEICDYFEVKPLPFIIIAVISANVGSAGTVLGNPIGIIIASKSGLTFEDFMIKAFPLMLIALFFTILLLMFWYRKALDQFNKNIKIFGKNEMLLHLISVPPDRQLKIGLFTFGMTILFIALHHRLEVFFNLEANTMLLIMPLIFAAIVMIWKSSKAREYVEKDVEWWTLLFFMLLFAQAGTLKYTGATNVIANSLAHIVGHNPRQLISVVLWSSAIGSSILDNVVFVAAFIPIIHSFEEIGFNITSLWWALLFGGCFGGNITMIGSTANIVALGILEKERNIKIVFFEWFWIGATVGVFTTCIVWLGLLFLPFYR
ncbi:MAG: hypothetical protein KJ593_00735 [Candidatus Omnitrophica bacterium]|nr:hypothetical protein [Candidatus Omnitrophota bacterium]